MEDKQRQVFQFFNEVGIINQLSTALFNRVLPDGIHASHFSVLNHFVRLGDGKTPLQLAEAFQVTKGTMTHTLATLSKRGFVRLAPHETDGRSKVVFITQEGRAFQRHAMESLLPVMQELGGKLDIDTMISMLPRLAGVRQVLDENRDIGGG